MPNNYKANELLGAADKLLQFIAGNTAEITAKGLTPATISTALGTSRTATQVAEGVQEDKKTELKVATGNYKASADSLYNLFSSNCDLLIGAFGKGSPKAKQITAIRKQLTKKGSSSGGSSSSSGGGSSSSASGSSSSGGSSSSSAGGGGSSSSSS